MPQKPKKPKKPRKPSPTEVLETLNENLTSILTNSCDLENRRLYITGDIEEHSSYRFIVGLHVLDSEPGMITVVLNTGGGVCSEGLAIYDAIKFARNEVCIVVLGQAASMGSIILQAGDKRLISPRASVMIHNVAISDPTDMSLQQAKTLSDELARLQKIGNEILSLRSGQTIDQVAAWCHTEKTFSAIEAVKYGFCDAVLED